MGETRRNIHVGRDNHFFYFNISCKIDTRIFFMSASSFFRLSPPVPKRLRVFDFQERDNRREGFWAMTTFSNRLLVSQLEKKSRL